MSASAATPTRVYAPLSNSSISAINTSTGASRLAFTNTIPGFQPENIYTSPDGNTLFEVSSATPLNYGFGSTATPIYAFDVATRKKVISYTTTYPPFQDFYSAVPFAVSPDGTLLLVGTCSDIDVLDDFICLGGDVEVFNVATGKELAVVSTSINEVYGIAVAPDGRTAYVSSSEQPICEGCADALPVNALSAIDLATFTLGSSLSLGNTVYPTMITIAPNGKTLYLGTYGASLLSISLPALKINQTVPVTGSVNIGLSANGAVLIAAASADVTNLGADTITVLNPANLSILGTVAVPPYSRNGFAVGPAGGDVYLGNGSVITQVNTSSLSVTRTIEVHHESSLALNQLGETLLELQVEAGVDSGNAVVGVFTKGTLQPVRNLYTPSQASWLAVSPDGSTLYQAVAGDAAGGVQAVSLSTGALLQTYLPNGLVASMALSPDGKTLYAVGFPSVSPKLRRIISGLSTRRRVHSTRSPCRIPSLHRSMRMG